MVTTNNHEASDNEEATITISEHKEKLWDSFQDTPSQQSSGSSVEATKRHRSAVKIVKFFVSIIIFIVILGSSVLSKITLLFMVSHIGKDQKVPYCHINLPDREFQAILPVDQRIAWIWAIIFAYAIPELGTFIRAWRFCFFKNIIHPKPLHFFIVFSVETLHVIGLALLLVTVLPNLDVIQGVMITNCLCFIPAIFNVYSDFSKDNRRRLICGKRIKTILNIFALICQLTGTFVWPLVNNHNTALWLTPVAIILISFHWWENFVPDKSQNLFIVKLTEIKKSLANTRYSTYLYISIWKLCVFAVSVMLLSEIKFTHFFTDFLSAWEKHKIEVVEAQTILNDFDRFPELAKIASDLIKQPVFSAPSAVYWTLFIQVLASYVCYIFTKFACKIKIQALCFALPINLTVPVSISILLIMCGLRQTDVCAFHDILPDYLFFIPPSVLNLDVYLWEKGVCISFLWLISQTWITRHIWIGKSNKNASTDTLFVTPLYNGLVIDQSLALNRRRKDLLDNPEAPPTEDGFTEIRTEPEDIIPRVFICGTMWHEEKEEMMEFLKSILRLDEDQCSRRLAKEYFNVSDKDSEYYELETHIYFDDAFVKRGEEAEELNQYVKVLIHSIPEAAKEIYKTDMKIRSPMKYVTPYGGRLEWTLPGKTRMIAHLKNAAKIRAKKRWSQVMYMYYLLGFKIMENLDISESRKMIRSENTFILALDGDIDFQPDAVLLLINRMKVDKTLGAACGRIHPIGSGPMVWYQKFEYAIGHWLQKATEHVIGCVLCSPGCFSLFRGSALMDNSVMKKYTTNSEVAKHFVQYDQGEDRWLCTLILKQRYRVEYSAASDAYTHSPEGFYEFYNQRRRWIPSTMANIMDLLMDSKEIVKKNDSISMLYIWYQMLLMVGTILGPGTIFLMMIGSLVSVFSIDIWTAFLWNVIPLILFMLICYKFKKYQLLVAFILSSLYALVMMAVLIGVIIQFSEDGVGSPSSIFFAIVIAQIAIAAILHPQEWDCIICFVIYYLTIPSMYMLLVIYSLFNMNDVSWGTRETPKPENTDTTEGNDGKIAPPQKKEEEGLLDISFFGLFRIMLCPRPKQPQNDEFLNKITTRLDQISNKIESVDSNNVYETSKSIYMPMPRPSNSSSLDLGFITSSSPAFNMQGQSPEKSINPDWIYDPEIKNGETATLASKEKKFWTDLIEKYLKPHKYSDEQKQKHIDALGELRDKCVFTFVMLNAIFVLIIFLLQLNKDYVYIEWRIGATYLINYDETTSEIMMYATYLHVEPIGFIFVILFGLILIIQFIGMLVHRLGTLSQILADVNLDWCSVKQVTNLFGKRKRRYSSNSLHGQNAVKLAKILQKPDPLWDDDALNDDEQKIAIRRNTIKKMLVIQEKQRHDSSDLERNFRQNPETHNIAKEFNLIKILNIPNNIIRKSTVRTNNINRNEGGDPSLVNNMNLLGNANAIGPFAPAEMDDRRATIQPVRSSSGNLFQRLRPSTII